MGKTIRVNNNRVRTGKGCKRAPLEDQLFEVKQILKGKIMKQTPEAFITEFKLSEFSVDNVFPNTFGETVEQYVSRNVLNYVVVIEHVKEMIDALHDTSTDRPFWNELTWALSALNHNIVLEQSVFDDFSIQQKDILLKALIEESEIRLTMLQSIPVNLISSVTSTSTPESEIKMNTSTTTPTTTQDNLRADHDVDYDAIAKAAKATTDAVAEKAAEATKQAAQKVADFLEQTADAAKQTADAIKEEVKPGIETKTSSKRFLRLGAIFLGTAAVVGTCFYLYKTKTVSGAVSAAGDLANEQVVGG